MVSDSADRHGSLPVQRLVEQLERLGELSETLTFRVVELEERLAEQQATIEASAAALRNGEDQLEERLLASEQRLARVESLLRRVDSAGRGAHLEALAPPALQQEPLEPNPFPEEGEQPFMDERVA
jgi:chromosome segregation ATPase